MTVSWRFIDLTLRYEIFILAALAVGAAVWMPSLTAGVALGGGLAIFNILGSKILLPRAVTPGQINLGFSILLMLKFIVTFGILTASFFVFELDGLGIAIGFGGAFFLGTACAFMHTIFTSPSLSETTP